LKLLFAGVVLAVFVIAALVIALVIGLVVALILWAGLAVAVVALILKIQNSCSKTKLEG
jgi:hypothetical protein